MTKKCRIYAACGVSQTPMQSKDKRRKSVRTTKTGVRKINTKISYFS